MKLLGFDTMRDISSKNKTKPNNLVQTIERVSLILDVLGEYSQGVGVGELSEKLAFPKGTIHRLLSSLAYFDFARKDPISKKYRLGFKLIELGNCLLNHLDFQTEARPFLVELAEQTKETVHMVILDHNEALYIDKVESSKLTGGLRMVSMLGTRIPAHSSAVGKVLLSSLSHKELDEVIQDKGLHRRTEYTITNPLILKKHLKVVREQGYAIDIQENEKGVCCVGAPIMNRKGRVIAAISISGPSFRLTPQVLCTSLRSKVMETALIISKKLGYPERQQ
jgi:DNA-binding IclR family transcriptional regulator